MKDFERLAFTELRLVAVNQKYQRVSNKRLLEAMTANEELRHLGYTLTPAGIKTLANADDIKAVIDNIRDCDGSVDAAPMYPDFPNQVMDMDEAAFRLHQMIHYFSTYGIELLTGEEVDRGWIPDVTSTEKTEPDTTLLEAKVIELIPGTILELASVCYKRILSKRERMTDKERTLVKLSVDMMCVEDMIGVGIPFKQNILDVANTIFDLKMPLAKRICCFSVICKHTGDVWKALDYILVRHKFHLRTSQKRMMVKVLESYPISDFKANLIITNKKADRVKIILNYLDYNTYSRSPMHMAAVNSFRNDMLTSWEGIAKKMIDENDPEALAFVAERPGIMLRWLTLLLRRGYPAKRIAMALSKNADQCSTQTLVSLLTKFGRRNLENHSTSEVDDVMFILRKILKIKLSSITTNFAKKKVYIDDTNFNLFRSELRVDDKSDEGGYVRSGIAYRIPENVNRVRFFTYWNDTHRVDIDLHAYALYKTRGGSDTISHIGFNANFRTYGLVSSGDMTTSDSAEYIDISFNPDDMLKTNIHETGQTLRKVLTIIDLYNFSEINSFKKIETCFVGLQAVDKLGECVELYNPENCFFKHFLTSDAAHLMYGVIDIENKTITFLGSRSEVPGHMCKCEADKILSSNISEFNLLEYLDTLIETQMATRVNTREEADIVLVMEKGVNENEISLIDNNFFMDK